MSFMSEEGKEGKREKGKGKREKGKGKREKGKGKRKKEKGIREKGKKEKIKVSNPALIETHPSADDEAVFLSNTSKLPHLKSINQDQVRRSIMEKDQDQKSPNDQWNGKWLEGKKFQPILEYSSASTSLDELGHGC